MNASISAGMTRRTFLGRSAAGIGSIALGSLLQNDLVAGSVGALSSLHHPAKAKRVIFLFMAGGPSHIDLFDPKPKLNELDGKPIPDELLK
ncbi:MAG TPA: sulfatase, partial [Verrucomicrobiales bacterium]|nr:sulfatase [Verrucomicrobiales bacterium]